MPVYEFECEKCGKTITKQLSILDETKVVDCECGGSAKKVISLASFHLKGGGWYKDGYSGSGN